MGDAELRRYPRVVPSRRLVVAWQSGTRRAVSYLESVGLGGLFILTRQPVPIRSMVKILVDLPFGEVRARAVVRRVTPARGMGLEFIAMTQEDRARLSKALQPMLATPTKGAQFTRSLGAPAFTLLYTSVGNVVTVAVPSRHSKLLPANSLFLPDVAHADRGRRAQAKTPRV